MTWLSYAWPQVIELLLAHLILSVPPIVIATLVAVPLGRYAFRHPRLGNPLLSLASLLYAIPALPLLIMVPVLFGVPLRSQASVIIALSIYGTALLVRTAADAFSSVDPVVRQAAQAIGYSRRSMLWKVDLPLAVPVLISGIRVITVSTVGLVTIGALVGISNLGTLFTDGFQRGIPIEVITGVILTVIVALVLDGLVLLLGWCLTPWTHTQPTTTVEVKA